MYTLKKKIVLFKIIIIINKQRSATQLNNLVNCIRWKYHFIWMVETSVGFFDETIFIGNYARITLMVVQLGLYIWSTLSVRLIIELVKRRWFYFIDLNQHDYFRFFFLVPLRTTKPINSRQHAPILFCGHAK